MRKPAQTSFILIYSRSFSNIRVPYGAGDTVMMMVLAVAAVAAAAATATAAAVDVCDSADTELFETQI